MSDELIKCQKCGDSFNRCELENTEYEFVEDHPICPDCQDEERQEIIQKHDCEYCDAQAEHMADGLYLCDNHHDDYLEHHPFLKD